MAHFFKSTKCSDLRRFIFSIDGMNYFRCLISNEKYIKTFIFAMSGILPQSINHQLHFIDDNDNSTSSL